MSYENDLLKKIKDLKIKENSTINILLLGETGVGKSTFINAIANYLKYGAFQNAEKKRPIALIPINCKVKDRHGVSHTIQIDSEDDQNDCSDEATPATQDVRSYVLSTIDGIKVRFIDTPGIGEARGTLQNYTNCEKILNYIGQLHELDGICCLIKSTNSTVTHFFDKGLTQILSQLDKSASKNVIFIFTHTRVTRYDPGVTLSSLHKCVNDMKTRPPHVDVPLDNNVFCFDNEALRFLAAINEKVELKASVIRLTDESWTRSAKQWYRLLKYIVGDSTCPPLKSHFIKSPNAINEARRLIVQHSQPLTEISQLICDNLYALQKHTELGIATLEEMKQKLYIPVIDLDVITLTQPITVCASRKCAEIYKVGDINKWRYKQKCHDPCFLKNVPKEVVGSPELVQCAAIDSSTITCTKCNCDFSTHMHMYYMTKTVENKIVDKKANKSDGLKELAALNIRKYRDISNRKNELEKEHSVIVKTCAKFAHFLQNNSIIPFSDSYKDYIEYLIIREKTLGSLSQMFVIQHLQKLLQEYEEAKQSFSDAVLLQKKMGESDALITPQKIQESIQELYKLKYNGDKIKELYECQRKSRTKEYKQTEYVYEIPYQIEEDINKHQRSITITNKNKAYHQSRQSYRDYDHPIHTSERQGRDYSHSRHRGRDHWLPPPYRTLSQPPPDPRYQYHSRPNPPPYNQHEAQYRPHEDIWLNHGPPNYQRPHSSLGDYSYRHMPAIGPDSHYPNPDAYREPRYGRPDVDASNRNKQGRGDSYELRVVVKRPDTSPAGPPSNIPPLHLLPHRQHFQPDFYPPRRHYSQHEGFQQYSGGHHDYYRNQDFNRPGPSQRTYQNRPNEWANSYRGGAGNRGRGGNGRGTGQQPFIKNKNLDAEHDSD